MTMDAHLLEFDLIQFHFLKNPENLFYKRLNVKLSSNKT